MPVQVSVKQPVPGVTATLQHHQSQPSQQHYQQAAISKPQLTEDLKVRYALQEERQKVPEPVGALSCWLAE